MSAEPLKFRCSVKMRSSTIQNNSQDIDRWWSCHWN